MLQSITISQFLFSNPAITVLDVRTPAEFAHGHIPGASNLPLFTNEERVQVGTTYKQQGKELAILLGFDLTGAKWSQFIRDALVMAPDKKLAVHCWRGGMRSGAMAWALNLYGFDVHIITGGYKNYRRWAHQQFAKPFEICLVGGMTGSGKTKILHELRNLDEQVIDLEDLAAHQGSVYGSMNKLVQPTQEQFENNLAFALSRFDSKKRVWVEDESINIGRCQIPKPLWNQMLASPLVDVQLPVDLRVESLTNEYGILDQNFLIDSTAKIRKRLGPEQCNLAISAIREKRMADFVRQVLVYYDKTYRAGLGHKSPGFIHPVILDTTDHHQNALKVLKAIKDPETFAVKNQHSNYIN
ncbi:tRNA 2-selenouridine(34) synthase MnmH [Flavitalea sp.]|nr:tRNA 2-selenouridine(34) synthase MnmH [Flavitalea sp.]